jgi:beta-galactosidase
MYSRPWDIQNYLDRPHTKPFIICEYSHAMGNSNGNLKEYWDIFYADNAAQGGFIWDWRDQGLQATVPDTYRGEDVPAENRGRLCYVGGDWFEDDRYLTDNAAVNDGLLSADGRPHPGLVALKKEMQNVLVEPAGDGKRRYKLTNRFYFQSLSGYCAGTWRLLEDGRPITGGEIQLDGGSGSDLFLKPGESREFEVAIDDSTLRPECEYILDFRFNLASAAPWAPAGHELAWEQFVIAEAKPKDEKVEADLPFDVSADNDIVIRGRDFSATIDDQTGFLADYTWRGSHLLAAPMRPDFWRAPVDNDRGARLNRRLRAWRSAGESFRSVGTQVQLDKNAAVPVVHVKSHGRLEDVGDAPYSVAYSVDATGKIIVSVSYEPNDQDDAPMLPRFGTLWTLDGSYNQITWYGRGPQPTYSDRKQAPLGIYSGSARDQFVHYFRPQESSNKSDVRWVAVTNPSGIGLLATGSPTLSVGVSEFDNRQMEAARYDFELQRRNRTYLNLDMLQMGVGGNDSWGSTAMHPYLPQNHDYEYSFTIRGIDQPPAMRE